MNALDRFTPPVRAWFEEAFGRPTPPQEKGWPPIQAGEHTLILSPTGSGKTLAAFLWGIDRLFAELEAAGEPGGVRLLYVSPLKALNNDIERNLRRPLAGVRQVAEALGRPLPELRVAVRTGDTPGRMRSSMVKRPPHILITTPESLYLILTSSRAREMLRTVRTVIVDEIHTVAGNKRGVHLALSLERLQHLAGHPIQRIGLSATQRPLEEVARFLGGQELQEGQWLPRPVAIVDAGLAKPLDLRVITVVEDFRGLGGSIWPSIEQQLVELIRSRRSTLVFTNGRRLAERLASQLSEELGTRIRAHHGSMSPALRLETEADLKEGRLPALVGTSSLELGIDIGAVDLVVQVQSPKGVAQGLQRVGRSGHLVGQTSVGRIFPTHREDLMEAAAVAGAMLRGEVETTRVPENCLDVLAQQIVAAVAMEDWPADALYDLIRQSYPYRNLPLAAYREVLAMLSGKYPRELFRELRPRIDWDPVAGRLSGLPGSAYLATSNAGTIVDRGAFGAYLSDGHTKIGELDEEFIFERREGDVFALGSRTWRIRRILDDRVIVEDSPGALSTTPFWRGDTPWRSYELGVAVGRFRRQVAERLHDPDLLAWLQREHALDENSARNVVAYVRDQLEIAGAISSDQTVVVELLRDPLGDARLIVHSPFGERVNAAWGLALVSALRERFRTTPECQCNDDAILLRLPEADQPLPVDVVGSLPPEEARERILAELPGSALFGAQFRQNATRALLMPRARRARRTPFWLQRLRAKDLLAVARQFDSFPILVETYRDCLRDVLDLENLLRILVDIRAGRIRVVAMERATPSPAAAGLLRQFMGVYMYEWDEPKAERQLQQLSLDRTLLEELLGGLSLAELLRPEALAETEAHLQRTAPGRRARSPQELALLLQELGDLDTTEILARCAEGGQAWLEALAREGRIVEREIPTAAGPVRRWLLAEEVGTYERAFHSPAPSPPKGEGRGEGDAASPQSAAAEGSPLTLPSPLRGEGMSTAHEALLGRLLATRGPLTVDEIRARYDFPIAWLEATLAAWAAEGRVARAGEQWCDWANLEQARRRTLALLRREIAPVPIARYIDFLTRWQHVHPQHRLPAASGLRRALQQLRAFPAPALLWTHDLLPARVEGFQAAHLDALCQAGEVMWVGSGRGAERPSRLRARFLFRGEGALYLAEAEATQVSEAAKHLLAFLGTEGACFAADLERGTGLRGNALAEALIELVAAGLVTNDSLRALHELVRFRPASAPRPLSSLEAQLAALRGGLPVERRPSRLHDARRRAARRLAALPQWVGRWSLVHRPGTWGPEATPEEHLNRQARQLLARYGIVARECLAHEELPTPWSDLCAYLEMLEMRGEVRRGHFVDGLSGPQFGLPEAVERLRERSQAPGEELVVLGAHDPAWLAGSLVTAGLRAADGSPLAVPRRPGTYVVLQAGTPVLVAERWGRAITAPCGVEEKLLAEALHACFYAIAQRSGRRRIAVETWNGRPAIGSAGQPLLEHIGGHPHALAIEWQAGREQ